jgi:hypothetical protein
LQLDQEFSLWGIQAYRTEEMCMNGAPLFGSLLQEERTRHVYRSSPVGQAHIKQKGEELTNSENTVNFNVEMFCPQFSSSLERLPSLIKTFAQKEPMKPANVFTSLAHVSIEDREINSMTLHPSWRAFVHYCTELQHGEIEILKIQDGLPVLAEITRKKIKFAR